MNPAERIITRQMDAIDSLVLALERALERSPEWITHARAAEESLSQARALAREHRE